MPGDTPRPRFQREPTIDNPLVKIVASAFAGQGRKPTRFELAQGQIAVGALADELNRMFRDRQ